VTSREALVISIGIALGLGGVFAATRSPVPPKAKQPATVTPEAEDVGLRDTSIQSEPTVPKLEIEDITADGRDDPFAPAVSVEKSHPVSDRSVDISSDVMSMDLDEMAITIANNIVRFKTKVDGRRVRTTGYIAGIASDESGDIGIGIFSDYKSKAVFRFSKDFESKVAVLEKGHTVTLEGYFIAASPDDGIPCFDGADVVSTSPKTYVSPEDRFASAWADMMLSTIKAAAESTNR
jgi:hypothetical protein